MVNKCIVRTGNYLTIIMELKIIIIIIIIINSFKDSL